MFTKVHKRYKKPIYKNLKQTWSLWFHIYKLFSFINFCEWGLELEDRLTNRDRHANITLSTYINQNKVNILRCLLDLDRYCFLQHNTYLKQTELVLVFPFWIEVIIESCNCASCHVKRKWNKVAMQLLILRVVVSFLR